LFSKNNQENIPQTEVKQTTQELVRENENKNLDIWLIKGFTKEQIEA
jgi:hypothetical protein